MPTSNTPKGATTDLPALTPANAREWLIKAMELAAEIKDFPERPLRMAKTSIRLNSHLDIWYACCEMEEALTEINT